MQKTSICLWFDTQAEEAAKFYTGIFKNSKIKHITHYSEVSAKGPGMPVGTVMTVIFELDGVEYMGLNGGPIFKHSPAMSILVYCDDQKEIDYYWEKLSAGGYEVECGWLTDKYGISWQICPRIISQCMSSGTPEQVDRVMTEVMKMKKLEIAPIEAAFNKK